MPTKSNHVCLKCKKEMMPERIGVVVEEHRKIQDHVIQGRVHTEWAPYKIWSADILECPTCGHQILAGFPDRPVAHHHEAKYAEEKKNVEFHIR